MKRQAIFGCLAAVAAATAVVIAEDRDNSDRDDVFRKTPIMLIPIEVAHRNGMMPPTVTE